MSNVERGLEACRKKKQDYVLATIRCLIKGEMELSYFWSKKYEEEKEKETLFILFRDLMEENRPLPGFLPEQN